MAPLTFLNYAVALFAEILVLVAAVRSGWLLRPDGLQAWLAGLAIAAVLIAIWGRFAAPNSVVRLELPYLFWFKAAVFGLAGGALLLQSGPIAAAGFAALVVVHVALALRLDIL